jgi:hypothetical protein
MDDTQPGFNAMENLNDILEHHYAIYRSTHGSLHRLWTDRKKQSLRWLLEFYSDRPAEREVILAELATLP